jgi:quercetin dioxygenase-like cupin family protein
VRSLIAGVDDHGRSCVVNEVPVKDSDINAGGRSTRTDVYELRETPPPVLPAKGRYHETGIAPGHVEYLVLQMPAGMETPLHYDDTINFYTVVAGSLDVLLDDGPHRLDTGDNLVVPGVDHGWTVGQSGCTMTILNLGAVRP